jgi:hypothetical protein
MADRRDKRPPGAEGPWPGVLDTRRWLPPNRITGWIDLLPRLVLRRRPGGWRSASER